MKYLMGVDMKYFICICLLFLGSAFAAEQKCTELGANCICSEPFNAANFTQAGSYSYNPDDSTTKECDGVDVDDAPINVNPLSDVVPEGSAAGALGAFPAGHSVNYYLSGAEGHSGIWWTGHQDSNLESTYTKRTSIRWYVYHSATSRGDVNDFQFKGEGSCENSKFAQWQVVLNVQSDRIHAASGWGSWTWDGGLDTIGSCCSHGPPNSVDGVGSNAAGAPTFDTMRGNWWRVETIITNRAGGASPNGFVMRVYVKNVSTGADEHTLIDTTIPDANVFIDNDWLGADDVTPISVPTSFMTNNYRQATCQGYRAISHYMMAGWDTDAGQRIGAAYEIEGGAAETSGVLLLIGP